MKTNEQSPQIGCRRARQKLSFHALILVLLALTACSRLPRQHQRLGAALAEESRALTTAVVDSLNLQPAEDRDRFTETALLFARQDQRLEGLPTRPFDLPVLLSVTNAITPAPNPASIAQEQNALTERFAFQDELIARHRAVSGTLIEKGIAAAQEQNRIRTIWAKRAAWIGVPLAALIVLGVFCPAALPIVGRLLAWGVAKVPGLAGFFGVVSVKAFDAVVRGIERAKNEVPAQKSGMANTVDATGAPAPWVDALHTQLAREMDASRKQLVRQRKQRTQQA